MTAASVADRFIIQRLGGLEVKGRSQAVQAHEVLPK
jgi:hypothetical protein